jgi:ABC-2 type transport system ATP-binding protein
VSIEFENHENKDSFFIPGIESLVILSPNTLSFMYSGKIDELVSYLAGKKMLNLMIEEPSLDEIFLHYYRN